MRHYPTLKEMNFLNGSLSGIKPNQRFPYVEGRSVEMFWPWVPETASNEVNLELSIALVVVNSRFILKIVVIRFILKIVVSFSKSLMSFLNSFHS